MCERITVNKARYHSLAIILHWLMALAIILMLTSGIMMTYIQLESQLQFRLYQWHKSMGVLLLLAVLVRVIVRLITHPPSLPSQFSKVDVMLAKIGHLCLYITMILMVVSGWIMVSASSYGLPTIVFGMFEWPHFPLIPTTQATQMLSKNIHFFTAITLLLLLFAHIGAVIKHKITDNENLLHRMWWQKVHLIWLLPALLLSIVAIIISFRFAGDITNAYNDDDDDMGINNANKVITNNEVASTSYDVNLNQDHGTVSFTGTHMGDKFSGRFNNWNANIIIDPQNLDQSYVHANLALDSASTGNVMYDGTLPQQDWFNTDQYPQASFISKRITLDEEDNSYKVVGLLKIRDISQAIAFDLSFTTMDIVGEATKLAIGGSFTINRLDYGIGLTSDPQAQWVSDAIKVRLDLLK
jgi:cytochrome b561